MCGIAGFLDLRRSANAADMEQTAHAMAQSLRHRGPDDEGVWTDPAAGIALASRRLAILDLSPAGHQPMVSESGRFILAYNGEVYNFHDIQRELQATRDFRPRGQSDTETILAAIEQWGISPALQRCNGMFALALWDRDRRELTLVRDRLGVKPLYGGWAGDVFLFGSELKALRAHPAFRVTIDRDALGLYMRQNCVPAPHSIYEGISKLPTANYCVIRSDRVTEPEAHAYWSLAQAAR